MLTKMDVSNTDATNIAGRDVVDRSTNFHGVTPSPLHDLLVRLVDDGTEETNDFIDQLKHFSTAKVRPEGFLGLEKKLRRSGAEDYYIDYALEVKEYFAKLLELSVDKLTIQEVYAMLMSNIRSKFMHHVRPSLTSKTCPEVLDDVMEKVIMPTLGQVAPNPLAINDEVILGMLFFLTGNCHLEWGNAGLQERV
ncbi:ABC-three component system protein [Halodesulfovibrio aestuarii]|uniref:ABC-three component system protein n=1 Tax=Halodesulfovibrio aestuarii TaxID=126333 RepID=UPI000488EF72